MTDLVEFITARLAEDEARAADAQQALGLRVLDGKHGWLLPTAWARYRDSPNGPESLPFLLASTPARALREVEAKRRVLARHHRDERGDCVGCGWTGDLDEGRTEADEGCPELLDMAATWSDHPDHRSEWSPTA